LKSSKLYFGLGG